MELNCSLSPLVYAELYSMLRERRVWADTLEERLEDGGLDLAWIEEAADMYRSYWLSVVTYEPILTLVDEHAHLASWLLAALVRKETSDNFSAELRSRVREQYNLDCSTEIAILPQPLAATVVNWTLGQVVGDYDVEYPVLPAVLPSDPDIATAYCGLVEHVATLPRETPWPEMLGSATHWRGAGLAESLQPLDPPNLSSSINLLVSGAKSHMPEHKHVGLVRHWNQSEFVPRRNALTHIRSNGGVTFKEASKLASDRLAIQPTIAGVTQFVCQRVCEELGDPSNRPPWDAKWRVLQNEITVW